MPDEYLTRAEVSKLLKISMRTLERAGGPVHFRIGTRIIYNLADVEAWLKRHRVDPDAKRPLKRGRPTKAEQIRRRRENAD